MISRSNLIIVTRLKQILRRIFRGVGGGDISHISRVWINIPMECITLLLKPVANF
jgi:hypothetical protein